MFGVKAWPTYLVDLLFDSLLSNDLPSCLNAMSTNRESRTRLWTFVFQYGRFVCWYMIPIYRTKSSLLVSPTQSDDSDFNKRDN